MSDTTESASEVDRLMGALMYAWGIICNGRAWDPAHHDDWEAAKFRFRDEMFHPALNRNVQGFETEQEP